MQPSNKHGENTNQGYGRPSIETVTTQESFDEAASGLADRAATTKSSMQHFQSKLTMRINHCSCKFDLESSRERLG